MNHHEISTLVRFNFWADERLLAACEQLPHGAFTQPVSPDPGWGSLRGVLVHILDAESGWRAALQDLDSDILLQEVDFPDPAALKARWEEERAAWLAYVLALQDADLAQPYRADSPSGLTVWQVILHVVMHGIQHRGEAAWVLTGYGSSPGELDFDVFLLDSPD